MLYRFYILLFFVLSFSSFGQDYVYVSPVFNFDNQTKQKVFEDETNVRQNPDLKSPIIGKLSMGQIVTVLEETKHVLLLGKRSAHWYKIRFDNPQGEKEIGYIWVANLSIGYRYYQGYDFLLGVESSVNNSIVLSVKVLRDNKLLQVIHHDIDDNVESLSWVSFKWLESTKGLAKPVDNILVAEVSGEACGVPGFTMNMLWDGEKLTSLPLLMNVGDAGVFYHTEDYIFPNDEGGEKGYIILKTEEGTIKNEDIYTGEKDDFNVTVSHKRYKIGEECKIN